MAELEKIAYYSFAEVSQVLDAAVDNDQVGWIVTDDDVATFLNRIADPYSHKITNPTHKAILEKSVGESKEANDDDLPF